MKILQTPSASKFQNFITWIWQHDVVSLDNHPLLGPELYHLRNTEKKTTKQPLITNMKAPNFYQLSFLFR